MTRNSNVFDGHSLECTGPDSSHPKTRENHNDRWRSILHSRNIDQNTGVTAYEMRSIIDLAEPALERAERLGLAAAKDGFWNFNSWLKLVDDAGLSALTKAVARIKKRLDCLISKGDLDAIDDHIWIAALDADCREETWRRIRFTGSPIFGDGSRHDAMQVHSAIGAARRAWHENVAAGHGTWGNGVWA